MWRFEFVLPRRTALSSAIPPNRAMPTDSRKVNRERMPLALVAIAIALAFTQLACEGTSSEPPPETSTISQEELLTSPPDDVLILDVRSLDEYAQGHVPNALNIPYDELPDRIDELAVEGDTPVVVYCESGKRAGLASATLREAGWTRVLHLDGDMRGWREQDRPIARGPES